MQTNSAASETKWYLYDDNGNLVRQRIVAQPNMLYNDTVMLGDGCYELRVIDTGGDGLSFFANNDGSGYIELRDANGFQVRPINPDFGSEVSLRFLVDEVPSGAVDPPAPTQAFFEVFPNPSDGRFQFNAELTRSQAISVHITNMLGQTVWESALPTAIRHALPIDLSELPSGLYTLTARTPTGQVYSQRLVVR
jgi:hypothetical protein